MNLLTQAIQDCFDHYQAKPLGNQKEYAVLLPIIEVDGDFHILYQVRAANISQGGQTSFPGGRLEKEESFQEAAIRECSEELQIDAQQIQILGESDFVVSEWSIIHCFVGYLKDLSLSDIQADPDEVERLFSVPLQYFVDNNPNRYQIQNNRRLSREFPHDPKDYPMRQHQTTVAIYDLPNQESLWGFTAEMTHRFSQILRDQAINPKDFIDES